MTLEGPAPGDCGGKGKEGPAEDIEERDTVLDKGVIGREEVEEDGMEGL